MQTVDNNDGNGFSTQKTVDNSVETVHNMLYIRRFIQKLQKFYSIRPPFLMAPKQAVEEKIVNGFSVDGSE